MAKSPQKKFVPQRVLLDTSILIWALREDASEKQKHMIARAKQLLKDLDSYDCSIHISTVNVAEFLVGANKDERAVWANKISRLFEVNAFCTNCSIIAAGLPFKGDDFSSAPRQSVIADTKICATAIYQGVDKIYTNDRHFTSLAEGTGIQVILLDDYTPEHHTPDVDLFEHVGEPSVTMN